MNRYFLSLTIVQGAVVAWIVATIIKSVTALATVTTNAIGFVVACAFFAAIYDVISND